MSDRMAKGKRVLPVGPTELQIEHRLLDDLGLLRSPQTRAMYDWYRDHRDCEEGPVQWAVFDLLDHAPLAENFFLVNTEDPEAVQIALHGEKVRRLLGNSTWTKDVIREDDALPEKRSLFQYYRVIIRDRRAHYCEIFGRGGYLRNNHFESIDLPMVDEEGKVVRILGVLGVIGENETPA